MPTKQIKTRENYKQAFITAYSNPFIIRATKQVNKVAYEMIQAGYSLAEVYNIADSAREFLGMTKITRSFDETR